MIVPVLRCTTGVNTKILVALELGIPLVITPVAASPFDLPENETIVAFADQALDFVQQTVSVYTMSWLWTQMARASRQVGGCATTTTALPRHLHHLHLTHLHHPLCSTGRTWRPTTRRAPTSATCSSRVCRDTNRRHFNNRWLPAPVPNSPRRRSSAGRRARA